MAEIHPDNVMTVMYAKAWLAQAVTNLKKARSEWALASKAMEDALTEIASHQEQTGDPRSRRKPHRRLGACR